MEKMRAVPLNREELNKLLLANHEKVMDSLMKTGAEAEQADPISVAYIAGRIDGLTDLARIRERSA